MSEPLCTPQETLLMYLNSERTRLADPRAICEFREKRFAQLCNWIDMLAPRGFGFTCPVCRSRYCGSVNANAKQVVYECHGSGSTLFIETSIEWRACPGRWLGTWEEMEKAALLREKFSQQEEVGQ